MYDILVNELGLNLNVPQTKKKHTFRNTEDWNGMGLGPSTPLRGIVEMSVELVLHILVGPLLVEKQIRLYVARGGGLS